MQPSATSSWEDLMVPYLTHLRGKRRSPRTMELREYQISRFFRSTGLLPAEVTIDHLRAWMDNPNWAPATCQVVKSSLGGYFAYLHDEEILPSNPARRLESPKVPEGKATPASDDAVAQALDKASPRVKLMVQLGIFVGLRAMEIAAVSTEDVVIGPHGATLRILGKGAKTRIVPLADSTAELIIYSEPGYLFPGRDNGHLSAAYISRLVSRVLPPGVTCHKLRHRFATRAYRNSNKDIEAVRQALGHSNISTTQRYVSVEAEEIRAAVLSAA